MPAGSEGPAAYCPIAEALGYPMRRETRFRMHVPVSGDEARVPLVHNGLLIVPGFRTIRDAQLAYCETRDRYGLGASNFGAARLFDHRGAFVCAFSYDGKVWRVRDWRLGPRQVFDAPRKEDF